MRLPDWKKRRLLPDSKDEGREESSQEWKGGSEHVFSQIEFVEDPDKSVNSVSFRWWLW